MTVIAGTSATVVAVLLGLYVPACIVFWRWYGRWTWRAAKTVQPLADKPSIVRVTTHAFGVVAVSGWRICMAVYVAALLLFVIPVALWFGVLTLTFAVIQPS